MNNNDTDLGRAFGKLIADNFFNHRGVLVERLHKGFKCCGVFCATMDDVDRVLTTGRVGLGNSINRLKSTLNGKEGK